MCKAITLLCTYSFVLMSYGCHYLTEDNFDSGFDKLRNEGFVAFIVNESEQPEDDTAKPDPDVNKCACKGTGYIWHGDGHQTKCPYHEEPEHDDDDDDDDDDDSDKDHRCKCDTRRTYCNCVKAHGKCNCKPE